MTGDANVMSLAELARLLKVQEANSANGIDKLVLASPWQRLPEQSGWHLGLRLGAGLLGVMLLAFAMQGMLTGQSVWLWLAATPLLIALAVAWSIRSWFWHTEFLVSASQVSLCHAGWLAPPQQDFLLGDIESLCFRQSNGRLQELAVKHVGGFLPIPISGRRELDRLYCNLLRHLLQKHCATIGFHEIPATTVAMQEAS